MQEPIEVGYQTFVSDGGEEFGEKARNYSSAREATFRHLPIRRHTSFVPIAATLSAEKYVTVLILSVFKHFAEIDLVPVRGLLLVAQYDECERTKINVYQS